MGLHIMGFRFEILFDGLPFVKILSDGIPFYGVPFHRKPL